MSDLNENDLILISGGGPAGFGAALAFSNNQYKNIIVLESRPDMNFDEENSYPVGINVRGRNAVKNLYANSSAQLNWDSLGLKVDQWKIIVGPGINVANFDSGLVYGTSRAGVTQLVYDETQRRNSIQVLFGHKTKSIDLKSKSVTCETNTGQTKVYKPACLVVADGYRSRIRDSLAESHKALKVQQWPWNDSFRVLISDHNVKTQLDPAIHYIHNKTYLSKFLNGRWTAVLAIQSDSPPFLTSNEPSTQNVDDLIKYIKKMTPPAVEMFSREEYEKYFSRSIFTGAVTKVSKLVIEDWAVLLGDAAHSTIPATGEGINSALEDCLVLQTCLAYNKNLNDALIDYEKRRLQDVNALSDMAYSNARPNFKSGFQMIALNILKKLRIVGPSKEDLLFGTNSSTIQKYTDIFNVWKQQTKFLGGPNVPSI